MGSTSQRGFVPTGRSQHSSTCSLRSDDQRSPLSGKGGSVSKVLCMRHRPTHCQQGELPFFRASRIRNTLFFDLERVSCFRFSPPVQRRGVRSLTMSYFSFALHQHPRLGTDAFGSRRHLRMRMRFVLLPFVSLYSLSSSAFADFFLLYSTLTRIRFSVLAMTPKPVQLLVLHRA